MKTIQPKQKLGLSSNANPSSGRNLTCKAGKMFWEMIDQIRGEELSNLDPQPIEARGKDNKSVSNG